EKGYDAYLEDIRKKVIDRLSAFHDGFQQLKKEGYRVESIAPEGAIYLTVRLYMQGQKTADGHLLSDARAVTKYILDEAHVALVPFYAFGASEESSWYRLSVGTCKLEDVETIISNLRVALKKLS
ncbi:MAG TPA: aminotransferase class I/II-fold pyridoxal phosphate-dependent enzyme, partial [Bacteroidia bacterium]|nr:aminotransferase class I/II-fold pyridoxal phosphate-dependent enzyme [Bacteroidia bacterium]